MVNMPFKKKPIHPVKNAVEINKIIDSGTPVKQETVDDRKFVSVNLRFPPNLLRDIDEVVDGLVGTSRTGWILQALHKEIKRIKNSKDD